MAYIRGRIVVTIAILFAVALPIASDEPGAVDPWAPIQVLLGEWRGVGSGFGGTSQVRHTYRLVLNDKFVQSTTRSEFQPVEGENTGEIHEDLGFFSFDSDRGKLVLRQFLSEGYVNTYVLEDPQLNSNRLVFTSESSESSGGMAARLTFTLDGTDRYELVLELASPGKDFFSCQDVAMERVE